VGVGGIALPFLRWCWATPAAGILPRPSSVLPASRCAPWLQVIRSANWLGQETRHVIVQRHNVFLQQGYQKRGRPLSNSIPNSNHPLFWATWRKVRSVNSRRSWNRTSPISGVHGSPFDLGQVQDVVDQGQQVAAPSWRWPGPTWPVAPSGCLPGLRQAAGPASAGCSAACAVLRTTCWRGIRTCTWRSPAVVPPALPAPAWPSPLRDSCAALRSSGPTAAWLSQHLRQHQVLHTQRPAESDLRGVA
jgi:hypothetical protein